MKKFVTSSRGRVTVLGDHQDYLGLRVLASPINAGLSFAWEFHPSSSSSFTLTIESKPLGKTAILHAGESLKGDEFDLARACLQALEQVGGSLSGESYVKVDGNLRPKSGLSSSAAFSIGFLKGLLEIAKFDDVIPMNDFTFLPELAFVAEHDILGVPCGKLDQYTCSSDQPLLLEFTEPISVTALPFEFPLMVIDSLIPKSTETVHVKIQELINSTLKKIYKESDLRIMKNITSSDIIKHQDQLTSSELKTLLGIIKIRECLDRLTPMLQSQSTTQGEINFLPLYQKIGAEMYKEHEILRNYLDVSHPKLDEIVDLANAAGALGAKLTGAGKGGAVVILLDPKNPQMTSLLTKSVEDHGFHVVDVMVPPSR